MGEKAMKEKAIKKVLSCFLVFAIFMSAMPFSVLASNSSEVVMGDTLDYLSEVDTHEDTVVSGVDNATNEAAYNLSDSNITGNTSNPSNETITQEEVVGSRFADGVSAKSSTYQTITVLVEYPPDGSTITPDTILILYDNSWNEVKRADTNGYTRYTFTDLDVGTYHVEAYKDNIFIGSAGNIIVGAGEGKFVTIKTFYKRNLDVTVYYNDGSTPIKDATVKVYSWDGYNKKWDYEYKGITNSQGKVTFSSWPTSCSGEKYKLVVEHNGYSKTKEPVYVNKDRGSSYIITTEEPTVTKYYIRPACQDVDGNHLDDVSYEFVDYPTYKGTCDYNEYLIAPGHGSYKVKFTKGDLEARVTLESHLKTFAGTVVTLRKTKKSDIIVIVKDPDDNAVTPDTAILYIPSGDVWKEIKRLNPTSNAYTFTNLNAGTYHTEAYKDNVFIGSAENIGVSVGVCQIAYITTLYKRNLDVKVCYKDGSTPVVGATVKVYSWDGHNEKWDYEYIGTTNSQGKVTFSSWPTSCSGEKYKLVVEHNGYSKIKEHVYVDRDEGGSYEICFESLSGDVDYSDLIRCISNETHYYRICYEETFNEALWSSGSAEKISESITSLAKIAITCVISQFRVLEVVKEASELKEITDMLGTLENSINVFEKIGEFIRGIKYDDIYIALYNSGSSKLRIIYLQQLIKNGEDIGKACENRDSSKLESLLADRANLIRDTYVFLPKFDENAAYCLKHPDEIPDFQRRPWPKWPIEPAYEYYIIHSTIGALHIQLEHAYTVTTSILNSRKPELKANVFLHKEAPEGKIRPQVLGGNLESIAGFGCLDCTGDTDKFNLKVSESGEVLYIGVKPFIEKIEEENLPDTDITIEIKQDGTLIGRGDGELEVSPIEQGTYDIYITSKVGSRFYNFFIYGKKEVPLLGKWPISINLQPSWEGYQEYPKPRILKIDIDKEETSVGDDVTLTIKAKNIGGTASWQSIAISSPDISAISSYTILSHNLDQCSKHNIGDKTGSDYGRKIKKLEYPLIEGAKRNWAKDTTGTLKLKIKPEKVGSLKIYVKSVAYGSGVWRSAPEIFKTSTKDQQNEYVYVKEVTVTGGGDTTPPETKCILSPSPPNGENGWYVTPVTVTLESTDDSSGIEWIKYYRIDSGSWQTYYGNKASFTVSNDGLHYVIYYAKDKAGNEEKQKLSNFFYIDKTKPSASISINSGAEYTNSRSVTLHLSYSDATSGVSKCRYKNEGKSWTSWESCSSTKSWTLTAGGGTKKVYYQVRDAAGNTKEVYDTIILKQEEPKLCTSPDPPSHDFGIVSKEKGTSWSFEIRNCGSGTLTWSVSDDKTWMTVYPTSGSTTTETDMVTVTIDIESCMYLSPGTHTGHVTITSNGGSKTGTITVLRENQPPTNPTLTPDKSSSQLAGTTIKWTASATDPDGDQLYYLFWLRGPATGNSWCIIKSYSTDNTWTWHTNSSDVGSNNICVYIKDGHHASEDLQKIVYGYEITPEKQRPTAFIDSITPNPATQGKDTVHFKGHGTDTDGHIVAYYWTSSIDGFMSSSKEFTKPASALSVGTHTIYFKVKDNEDQWSEWDTATLTIKKPSNQPPVNPTLTPDKSSSQPAGTTIKWTASATDPDGDQLYYRFWLRGPATGNSWEIIKSYSTTNTWTWHATSADVGYNDIRVWIRDGRHASAGSYDIYKIIYDYEITGNQRPTAKIDSITPNPATQGKDTMHFKGHGTDTDGYIVEYYWTSSKNGFMSSSKEFTKSASELSVGTHTIYFKVKDNDGQWSEWDTATLTIKKSSASNYKLDEYGVIQQEYNDDSGINRAAPPATDAMVLAPYIDLIPYGSVSDKVRVEIGIKNGQVTEYDPTGNAILSSGRSKLTWSNQAVTNDYHAELFYEADFRHTREVEAKIIPDQLKAEVRNIASYPLYNIIVLYPDSGYWRYATIDYLGVGAKKTVTLSSKKSPDSLVNNLYKYLEGALNDVGLVATQHRNDWLSGWVNYWLGIGFGSTYQPRVIYRLHQNQYEQYFTCSASPEPSKGMVRVGFVELFNVPTSSEPTKCKVPITTHSSLQDRPSIVYANGYYYVAYQSWEKGRGIFIKKFDSQWNFKKEKEVVSGSAYYDSPSLVFANNKLYVAYVSNEQGANANDYDVIVKEYDLDLKYISGSKKYLTKLQSCQDLPSLLYKDGYFYLAYQSWEKGNGDIFIKKFDSSWNPIKKVPVTSKSSYQDRPSIIYANGYFYVAYFSKETGNYDIFVKRLDSNLNLDSWKKQITSESSSQSYPFITFVNNEYAIVYASNEGGTLGIYMKKYNSNWNFIGKTKVVDDSSAHERRPSHIWDGSNYWVAYVYNYGESNDWNIFAIIPGCEGGSVPAPTPSPSCCPSMSISTGQDTYMPGDNVYVSITLTGRSGCTFRLNSPSIVSLIAPTGETVTQTDMAQGITSSIAPGGHYTIGRSMKLPLNAPLGHYDVKVSLSGGKCTETANGLFHVITV